MAPFPPPHPLSRQQVVSFSHFLPRTGGGWGRSRIISGEKAWSTIHHSILSETTAQNCRLLPIYSLYRVKGLVFEQIRVFTKVTFGISRKSKFYTKMVLFSRNFEQFRIFLYYFLFKFCIDLHRKISYNFAKFGPFSYGIRNKTKNIRNIRNFEYTKCRKRPRADIG